MRPWRRRYLSHRVSPLDETGYGLILGQTVRTCRAWHDRLVTFAETIREEFVLKPLTLPDTNILDYVFNPAGNDRLDVMNRFGLALYQELSIDPSTPVQTRQFIVSHTEFGYDTYSPPVVRAYLEEKMGVQGRFFVATDELTRQRAAAQPGYDDEMVVFRSTMMNLFTLQPVREGQDYLDLFLENLLPLLRKVRAELSQG